MSEYAEIKRSHDEGWITNYENVHVLIDIIEQMKEGLQFYGDPFHWSCIERSNKQYDYSTAEVYRDEGRKARELCKLTEE